MKIVVLDGYAANPGDLDWSELKALGECTIYDRTAPDEVYERSREAEILHIPEHTRSLSGGLLGHKIMP